MEIPPIPSGLLRSRHVYRTLAGDAGFLSCGFFDDARRGAMIDVTSNSRVLVYILRGEVELTDDRGRRYRCATGSCFQRLPGIRHSSVPAAGPYGECWIEAGGATADFLAAAGVIDDRPVLQPGIDLQLVRGVDSFLQRLRSSDELDLPRRAVELAALVGDIAALDRVRISDGGHRELIERSCLLLREGHASRKSLERLCRDHGLGYERFRKLFAAQIGSPVAEYRNRARIDRARGLLLSGDQTVQEIAAVLGWQSTASFSLYFRQQVGEAPAHFRARRRGGI